MENHESFESAKKQVMEIKGFYTHFIIYIIMAVFFLAINLITSPGTYWFYWPIFGWGIGVFFHALGTFNKGMMGKDWEERKIKELMEKDKKSVGK